MSFDQIILPKTVILEMYKDNLVGPIAEDVKKIVDVLKNVAPPSKQTTNFLGKNLKNIVVLVHYPEVVYLPDEPLDFLSKILLACKLDIGDIAIINTARSQANQENINTLHAKSLLIFGECPSNIPGDKKLDFFTPLNKEGLSVMTAPPLEKLYLTTSESKQLKSKLWLSLQQFFNL